MPGSPRRVEPSVAGADTEPAAISPPAIAETAPEEEEQDENNQDHVHTLPPVEAPCRDPLSLHAPSVASFSSIHLVKQPKKPERICIDRSFAAGRMRLRDLRVRLGSGIHHAFPDCAGWICRDPEHYAVVRRIQENKECVVRFPLAPLGQMH